MGIGASLNEALHDLFITKLDMGIDIERITNSYIFSANATGTKPWHPDTVTKRLCKIQDGVLLGRERITLRGLRTFVRTELVAQPFGLHVACDTLRHSSGQTTLRYYLVAEKKRNRLHF